MDDFKVSWSERVLRWTLVTGKRKKFVGESTISANASSAGTGAHMHALPLHKSNCPNRALIVLTMLPDILIAGGELSSMP